MLTLLSLWGPALAGDLKRRFADKVVIVIGGTSGIGRAAAPMFPAQGGRAAFCGRNVERGKPVEDEIHETGGDAVFIRAAEVKVIPDTAKEKPSQGEIIAVGPGGRDESGKLVDKTIGVKRIYLLNRANGRIDSDQLLVHKLRREANSHCLGCRSSDISARWLRLRVTSVALCDRWLPADFRYPPFAIDVMRRCEMSRRAKKGDTRRLARSPHWHGRGGLIRATPLSEDPRSAAYGPFLMGARASEQSTPIL